MYNKNVSLFIFYILSYGLYAQDIVSLCQGESHNFGVSLTQGSVYNWQIQNNTIAYISSGNGTNNITVELDSPGIFKLFVEEVDINGCKGYDSIMVEINQLPSPSISYTGSLSFCEGDSVLLKLNSEYNSFLWSNTSTLNSTYVTTTGNYYATVTDSNGCVNTTNSLYIQVSQNPEADFIIIGSCLGSPTTFINNSVINQGELTSLLWKFDNGDVLIGDSVQYIYNELGSYMVELIVETDSGCIDLVSKSFPTFNNIIADFEFTPLNASTLNPYIDFVNHSINGSIYYWDFGDSSFTTLENPTHEFQNSGIYNVTLVVSDTNQCIDSVQHDVIVYYEYILYMPSSFTPNQDGYNDNFGPKGLRLDKFKSYEFIIYNRWGDQIFITQDYFVNWDGRGSQSGIYNWVIILEDELGEIRKEMGEVMLIR